MDMSRPCILAKKGSKMLQFVAQKVAVQDVKNAAKTIQTTFVKVL